MKLTCNTCLEEKETTHFTRNSTKKSGFNYKCKLCHSAYLKSNRNTPVTHDIECKGCHKVLPATSYTKAPHNTSGLSSMCSLCSNTGKNSYANDKAKHSRIKGNKEFVSQYKLVHGCNTCGYNEHAVSLDLVHPQGINIQPQWGRDKIKTELHKCTVMCANCHSAHKYATEIEVMNALSNRMIETRGVREYLKDQ